MLKIISYNIHSGIGRDRQYRLDRTIEVIVREKPDIVALQEVDNNLSRSNYENQSLLIGEALDMHYHHCVNYYVENGEYGITTLSRFPILNKQRHDLSYRKRLQPRGTLRTDLQLSESLTLHVFNVHLGLRVRERHYQRKKLLSETILLDDALQDPVIVLGDFNDRPISVVHPQFRKYFHDVSKSFSGKHPPTFSRGPVRFRLDYIYISDRLKSIEAYVVETSLTRVTSDHLPMAAVVELAE
ncbi:MAG: hypothetical protein GWN00_25780 [Aliifodinibius sp.]|nr:hypothetical protein [Fodinibius sp.]NIV15736.1 hypothetical protein [Fodinibius sp.]NIY28085.1 hypothetical protein [Fodinibius sp.]